MKKIALCVLTYNHATAVDDVLKQCIKDYYDYDIDMYFYDGSPNNETEIVINQYINQGYDNLYYIHEEIENRFDMIFMSRGLLYEYEYIWISKDRSFCSRETLSKINSVIEEKNDVIFLGALGSAGMADTRYSDSALFYRDWAWLATSLDVTIYRRESMFEGYDKDKYIQLFGLHYSVLFNRLAELAETRIQVLCENVQILNSPKATSMWEQQVFKLWKEDWILVNEKLPECYNEYKNAVIRKAANLPWILGGRKRLVELHEKGILIPERLSEVLPNWERVSDIPFSVVEKIALGVYDDKHDLSDLPPNKSFDLLKKIILMLNEGTMKPNQVPYDDICQLLIGEIYNSSFLDVSGMDRLLRGSVEDLCNIAQKYRFGSEEAANLLQAAFLLAYSSL